MVAAGGPHGKGMCDGDSGGPLWVAEKGRYPVIGIASEGNCGDNLGHFPDVYTEVNNPSIRTFIVNAMRH
jgi:secreted trypsin-like serine protease